MAFRFNPFTSNLDNIGTSTTTNPGGTNTQVQFNDNGVFGAAAMYWDKNNLRLGINTTAPSESLDVIGNFQVADAMTSTKSYRFRTNGGNLDIEGSGKDIFLSVWSGAGYSGTQRNYLRLEAGTQLVHAIGQWNFTPDPFSGPNLTIDGSTGNMTFNDGANIIFGTTTGTKIGTSTTQKLGFYNSTPIAKQTGVAVTIAAVHAALTNLGLIAP